jgi:hypothetical protein
MQEILLKIREKEWCQSSTCAKSCCGWFKTTPPTFESMPGNPTALSAKPISGLFFLSIREI